MALCRQHRALSEQLAVPKHYCLQTPTEKSYTVSAGSSVPVEVNADHSVTERGYRLELQPQAPNYMQGDHYSDPSWKSGDGDA